MNKDINLFDPKYYNIFKEIIEERTKIDSIQVEFRYGMYVINLNNKVSYWDPNQVNDLIKKYVRNKRLESIGI